MTSLYKPITLFLEFYYMSNGLTFEIFNTILRFLEMACAKFQANRFRIDELVDEKHALEIY